MVGYAPVPGDSWRQGVAGGPRSPCLCPDYHMCALKRVQLVCCAGGLCWGCVVAGVKLYGAPGGGARLVATVVGVVSGWELCSGDRDEAQARDETRGGLQPALILDLGVGP